MDNAKQIIRYLEDLASVLAEKGVAHPFHLFVTGGAYMLIMRHRKSTADIDFALIEAPRRHPTPQKEFMTTVQRGELASHRNKIPFAKEFREAVTIVAHRHRLPEDWCNDEASEYYYDDAPHVPVSFWREFGGLLYVYLPSMQYILATKLKCFRPKDEQDIRVLCRELKIRSREQAKAIVDAFILPEAQEFWEMDEHLDLLFPE